MDNITQKRPVCTGEPWLNLERVRDSPEILVEYPVVSLVLKFSAKGQLILKCPYGVFKSSKKNKEIFSRISALASKKRSNQKSSVRESK